MKTMRSDTELKQRERNYHGKLNYTRETNFNTKDQGPSLGISDRKSLAIIEEELSKLSLASSERSLFQTRMRHRSERLSQQPDMCPAEAHMTVYTNEGGYTCQKSWPGFTYFAC